MRMKLGLVLITLAMSAISATTAMADWKQDDKGWWYQYQDGSYAKSGIKQVEGKNYCFDGNGYMQTDWKYVDWKWYYFGSSGPQLIGWAQLADKWYYLDPEDGGAMRTYWLDLPDPNKKGDFKRYYLDENGVLQMGTFYLSEETAGSGFTYQTDESGALLRNKTLKQGDGEIRYDEDGVISVRNAQTIKQAQEDGSDEWQYLISKSERADIQRKQQEKSKNND